VSLSFARWSAVAQTRSAACLVRDVMFEITIASRSAAGRSGTDGVPDLAQVPQLDSGFVAPGLEAMVAVMGGDRIQGDQQISRSAGSGVQPCPMAWPCLSVTVTHQVVLGCPAAANQWSMLPKMTASRVRGGSLRPGSDPRRGPPVPRRLGGRKAPQCRRHRKPAICGGLCFPQPRRLGYAPQPRLTAR